MRSRLFILCLIVRVINVSMIRTAFAPDEYWQGPEVAHRIVFGYGHLTWEWAAGIRSYVHPLMYAAVYKALQVTGVDSAKLIQKAPMLLHSFLAAFGDIHVHKIADLVFGEEAARWTLILQLVSWFNGYCIVRTYSNSLEASLLAIGMYHWLMASRTAFCKNNWRWIVFAAFSIIIRPPSALFWGIMALWAVVKCESSCRNWLIMMGIGLGGTLFMTAAIVDRFFYHRWVFVPWEFFKFNLLQGGSELYGSHPWYWNFTSGIPVVLASYILLLHTSIGEESSEKLVVCACALLQLAIYSLPSHKEFRFLLPALQVIMPLCGAGAERLVRQAKETNRTAFMKIYLAFIIAIQFVMFAFFAGFHQRAQVQVMELLGKNSASTLLLTPCHSTPFYAYIHKPIPIRFLDCSPPGTESDVERLNADAFKWLQLPHATSTSMVSQRQYFEADPVAYVHSMFELNSESSWPHVIVAYTVVMKELEPMLSAKGYAKEATLWNCFGDGDDCSITMMQR